MQISSIIRAIATVTIATILMNTGTAAQGTTADPCALYLATPPVDDHDHGTEHGDQEMGGMATSGPAAELPDLDLAFIDLMTPHHEGAVVMSEIALVRAERPEIVDLARSIIDSQTAEQDQMREWRSVWYPDAPEYDDATLLSAFDTVQAELGVPADAGAVHDHMDPAADARAICSAAEPFDLAFIDRMISHHQAAIGMAEVVLVAGEREEIRTFAQAVIDDQSAEIAQMQVWREQWFGATPAATVYR